MIRKASYVLAAAILHAVVAGTTILLQEPAESPAPVQPDRPLTIRLRVGDVRTQPEAAAEAPPDLGAEESATTPAPRAEMAGDGERSRERKAAAPTRRAETAAKPPEEEGADGCEKTPAHTPKGRYPSKAAARGWEGTVRLRFRVASDGRCSDVTVLNSSGYRLLDQDAVEVVREKWRFPVEDAGREVAFEYTYCLTCADAARCGKHAR